MPSYYAGHVIVGRIIIKSRKNMKRAILFCIIFCLVAPIEMEAKKKLLGNGVYWELSDNGKLTISGNGAMPDFKYKKTPWYNYRNNIQSIEIEEGVIAIGKNAFVDSKTYSVVIPSSVRTIGAQAFSGCCNLSSVTLPSSILAINSGTFYKCTNLKSVKLPDSLQSIGVLTFGDCTNLSSIVLPKSLQIIEYWAFENCVNLKSITIPKSVKAIGREHNNNNCVTAFAGSGLHSIIIEEGVEIIDDYAFMGCRYLESLVIPSSVSRIGKAAFLNSCGKMEKLLIPNSVKYIGESAFQGFHGEILEMPSFLKKDYERCGLVKESVDAYNNGIFDAHGKLILSSIEGRRFVKVNDYYIVEEENKKGILKENGIWIVKLTTQLNDYSEIRLLGNKFILVGRNGYFGIMDFSCRVIIPCSRGYTFIGDYDSSKGIFAFTKKGYSGTFNAQGVEISTTRLAPSSDDIKTNGGYASAVAMNNGSTKYYKVSKGGRYGLTNAEGKVLVPVEMDALESAGAGYLRYKLNGFWGLMNYQGKILIDTDRGYTSIGDFKSFNKRFAYTMTGYKGECDATGRQISKMKVETPKQNTSVVSSSSSSSSSSSDSKNNNSGNKTTTVVVEHHRDPVPVQDWVPCSVCGHNPGVCQTCVGNKTNYRGDPCISCRGTGKCHFCNGQGGRYQIVYR